METTYGKFKREDLLTGYAYEQKPAIDVSLAKWRDCALELGMTDTAAALDNALDVLQTERARKKSEFTNTDCQDIYRQQIQESLACKTLTPDQRLTNAQYFRDRIADLERHRTGKFGGHTGEESYFESLR